VQDLQFRTRFDDDQAVGLVHVRGELGHQLGAADPDGAGHSPGGDGDAFLEPVAQGGHPRDREVVPGVVG
jgi:hypothetical protein